jgi:carboxyl-terminal processing protease
LLDASIEVARFFLEEGLVLIDRQRGGSEQRYEVREPGEASKIPMVVLVDGGTASAGEVVAGAFQAQGRAVLVGKETYGKGSVQAIFPLSDGSSLHVTMSRWYTPGGITLDEGGILPDIGIEDESEGVDEILEAGAKVLIERMRDDT